MTRPARGQSHRRGFTLIETIAALLILSIAIPPMLFAIRDAHVQRVNPHLVSTARWLATEKLEDVIADRHSATRGYDHLIPGNYPAEPAVTGYPQFGRSVTLTETQADLSTAGNGYMTVTVTVSWTDATATSRSLVVSTVLTEYE
jgi:prepilin-type N-terminal cleavage/methylation domain-containing protein